MPSGPRCVLALGRLVVVEAVAVFTLHRLGRLPWLAVGWSDLQGWLATTAAPDALAAGVRCVALAIAWWLLAGTLACAAACATGMPAALRAVRWVALPPVRRVVQRALTAGLAVATAVGPVAPAAAGDSPAPRSQPEAAPSVVERAPPALEGLVLPGPPAFTIATPAVVAPTAPVAPSPAGPGPARLGEDGVIEHVVARGEHLWGIAAGHLAALAGRPGAPAGGPDAVRAYWLRVIEVNTSRLRSGDPDCIFPGERLVLPPLRSDIRADG